MQPQFFLARMHCLVRTAIATAVFAAAGNALAQNPAQSTTAAPEARPTWAQRLSTLIPWSRPAKPQPPTGVEAPHYGDSLFYFYQSKYFSSVTSLMVSQHFDRMAKHGDEAEILRGGLFLSYGMHKEAGRVFAQLIERGAPPPVRDRAWYYLAKIRWQRGLVAEAADALVRIEKNLPADLEEDRQLLAANVMMARGQYREATELLKAVPDSSGAVHYARFNLGVAMIRGGQAVDGGSVLAAVGELKSDSEELRSLRDRANVAMGFSSLQLGNTELARRYLERVRLEGLLSNKALLGFGWAAAEQKRFSTALVPWNELARRDPSDPAVLEARLAVPYAYAELGAQKQAVALYQDALAAFDKENAAIDASIAAIRDGRLLEGLLQKNPGEEMGWFWNIGDLPDMPHIGPLAPILAQHEFQEAFKNYRDLVFLGSNLREWDDKLGVLRDMLANRKQAFSERLPRVREQAGSLRIGELEQKTDALREELTRVERDADVAALADARERDLAQRLERVREIIERGGSEPEIASARDRHRRAAGALIWEQTQRFPERLWKASKAMRDTEATLRESQQRDAALIRAQQEEPARLDAFGGRIEQLAGRVQAAIPRVAELTQQQQVAVQDLVIAELQRQKERLASYNTQARFALAQIFDRAPRPEPSPAAAGEGAQKPEGSRAQ